MILQILFYKWENYGSGSLENIVNDTQLEINKTFILNLVILLMFFKKMCTTHVKNLNTFECNQFFLLPYTS